MPVEIKELVIRAVVGKGAAEPEDGEAGGSPVAAASLPYSGGTEEIVQECVRQVLRIVAKNKER